MRPLNDVPAAADAALSRHGSVTASRDSDRRSAANEIAAPIEDVDTPQQVGLPTALSVRREFGILGDGAPEGLVEADRLQVAE
jgi:hypothetical protein